LAQARLLNSSFALPFSNRELTFHTRTEAEALFNGFELERFDEVEEDGQTALGEAKHWHLFHVVARRR
jgi:hypothetical protein